MSPTIAVASFLILLITIISAAIGVVRQADGLAAQLGEPYGTLILTLSIVTIEVILIAAVLLGPGEHPTIGKDSIFSVMMIIMNLIVGLCILLGGLKFGEQEYNALGTMTYLGMIVTLGGMGMLLPNVIEGAGGGQFSDTQALFLSLLIVILYGLFLFFQTKSYRHLYIQPPAGTMEIRFGKRPSKVTVKHRPGGADPAQKDTSQSGFLESGFRSLVLLAFILPIVLLSHYLAVVVDYGIQETGLPIQLGGVVIAIIVFTPESLTAIKAALNNEFQRAINLCHGAFVSTVGLSVPAVLLIGLATGKTILFGLTPTEALLFLLTFTLSVISHFGKRTTPIFGVMHLALFAVFFLLIFHP